ncbi:hypothetical protein BaRGS_00038062, partial [Batillaria attramentaria]
MCTASGFGAKMDGKHKASRSSGVRCSVHGCQCNHRKLNLLLEQPCFDHKPLRRQDCSCDPPYRMHRMPDHDPELRRQWLAALNRKDPPRNVFVCSYHFVDRKPTKENPLPELNLGYQKRMVQKRHVIVRSNPDMRSDNGASELAFHGTRKRKSNSVPAAADISPRKQLKEGVMQMCLITHSILLGLAAKPWDKNHPDWTPTLHMGHSGAKPVDVERYARAAARHARQSSQTSLSHPLLVVILHQKTRQPPDMVSQHSSSQEFTQLGNSPSSPHAECSAHTASLVTPSLVIKQEPEDEGLYQQEMSPGLDACTASVVSDNQTDSMSIKTEHHEVTSLGFDVGTPSLLWDNHTEIKSVKTQHQENTSLGVWLGTCTSDGLSDKKADRASSKTEHRQQTCTVRVIKQEPSDELFQNETLLGVDPQTPSVVLDNHTDMVSVKTEHQESSTLERTLPVAMNTPDDLYEDIKLDTGLFPDSHVG